MILRMQGLMQKAMTGGDVRGEMEDFERNLPQGFREKMAALMYEAHGVGTEPIEVKAPESESEARMTILRAVAAGSLEPEEAYGVLFGADAN